MLGHGTARVEGEENNPVVEEISAVLGLPVKVQATQEWSKQTEPVLWVTGMHFTVEERGTGVKGDGESRMRVQKKEGKKSVRSQQPEDYREVGCRR